MDWILNKSIQNAFDAFARGFWTVVSESMLTIFQPEEVEYLIRGSSEAHTVYFKHALFLLIC